MPFISAMPAPVRMTPRSCSRSESSAIAFSSSWSVRVSRAFSDFGRSTVTVANGPSSSRRTFTSAMVPSSPLVDVEATPGLLPQPAGVHVLAQQRARTVLGVAEAAVHHLGDEQNGVEADEVRELQRSHGLVGPELHRGVDVLGGPQA